MVNNCLHKIRVGDRQTLSGSIFPPLHLHFWDLVALYNGCAAQRNWKMAGFLPNLPMCIVYAHIVHIVTTPQPHLSMKKLDEISLEYTWSSHSHFNMISMMFYHNWLLSGRITNDPSKTSSDTSRYKSTATFGSWLFKASSNLDETLKTFSGTVNF